MNKHPDADCENCPLNGTEHKYVPSEGPQDAQVVFVGEAPGYKETQAGRPFVGSSGQLLDQVLEHHGIDRSAAFMTNAVLCRPTKNATPTKAAIAACSVRLKNEIRERKPDTIVTLGNTATAAIMGQAVKITSFRAGPPKVSNLYPNARIIPTFHPAACLRSSDSFPSMVSDIGKVVKPTTINFEPPAYVEFNDPFLASRALDELLNGYDKFVIDIETAYEKDATFERPNHYPLLCLGLCYRDGKAVILGSEALDSPQVQKRVAQLLEDKYIIAHNGKFDLSGLAGISDKANLDFDTMLASYALDERQGTHGLKYLANERLGVGDYDAPIKQYIKGRGKSWADVPRDMLHLYNAYDVACTWRLAEDFTEELKAEGLMGLNDMLTRSSNALMRVERSGLSVDHEYLSRVDAEHLERLNQLEGEFAEWLDNPRSPKQVKEALENIGILVDSTNAETLNNLIDNHLPQESEAYGYVEKLLEYRKVKKLYGTYIEGLSKRMYKGRLYTTFLLHGTTTGRPSSRNPNMFNIPRGSTIKSIFRPDPGNVYVQCDYSQIEFRVVAALAQEESVAQIFRDSNRDIFGEFAESLFGAGWTKDHRQIQKRIVHGTNYGMGPGTMADQINSDAKNFGTVLHVDSRWAELKQNQYYALVPNIMAWQASVKHQLFNEHDDLVTDFDRHRRFYLITEENKFDIQHEGLAFIPQSTASDICMRALVRLVEMGLDVKLSVYDSIMVECPADQAQDVARLMERVMMESGSEWSDYVPFNVDTSISAESWGALK